VALILVVAALLGVGAVLAWSKISGSGSGPVASARPLPGGAGTAQPSGGPSPGTGPAGSSGASASASSGASPSGSASASAGPQAASQAQALNALLDQSMNARQQVVDAVAAIQQCTSPASVQAAASALGQAVTARQSLLGRLGSLDMSQVPGGAAAVGELRQAWQSSEQADSAYQKWGQEVASTCKPNAAPQNADSSAGARASSAATTEKKAFVLDWNQIAAQYGLPSRTWDAI